MSEKLGKKAAKRALNQQRDKDNENIFDTKKFWYGCVVAFIMFSMGIMQFASMLSGSLGGGGGGFIEKLDIKDKAKLKEVFFSGTLKEELFGNWLFGNGCLGIFGLLREKYGLLREKYGKYHRKHDVVT